MKCLFALLVVLFVVAAASFEDVDMEEEMFLSKGYFEIVAEIHHKLRQLSMLFTSDEQLRLWQNCMQYTKT